MLEQEEESVEVLEFNKELQWTLMMVKKDNDMMRENLEFLMSGGDPKKVEDEHLAKIMGSEGQFKTPQVDNVFEMHSEFQSASAGIKAFDAGDQVTKGVELREFKAEIDLMHTKEDLAPTQDDLVPTKENGDLDRAPSPDQVLD